MPRKQKAISVYISPELKEYLEQWADEEKRSLANLSAYILDKAAQEHKRQKQPTQKNEES